MKPATFQEAIADYQAFNRAMGGTVDVTIVTTGFNSEDEIVLLTHDVEWDQHVLVTYQQDGNLTVAPLYKSKTEPAHPLRGVIA